MGTAGSNAIQEKEWLPDLLSQVASKEWKSTLTGTQGETRGNGCSVYRDIKPGCENCREVTFHCEGLLVSAAPTQPLREGKQTSHAPESWSLRRRSPGLARGSLPGHYKASYCFSSPRPPRTACHLHRRAINHRINSPRGKLAHGPRRFSQLSGSCLAWACLCFLPSTFLGIAGPRQARDIPSSTGKM